MTPAGPEDDDEDAALDAASPSTSSPGTQRLDKWLFYARVIKSRTQAAGLVTDGSVRINRLKVDKPSLAVRPGDVLTVSIGRHVRVLKVTAPGIRRGPASEARLLFEDLTPPPPPKSAHIDELREPGSGRPTKRDRRLTDKLKGD